MQLCNLLLYKLPLPASLKALCTLLSCQRLFSMVEPDSLDPSWVTLPRLHSMSPETSRASNAVSRCNPLGEAKTAPSNLVLNILISCNRQSDNLPTKSSLQTFLAQMHLLLMVSGSLVCLAFCPLLKENQDG